jgi:hypothetical protein
VVLNKVAEYTDIPERIRLRQVNSTLRDGVPPTVPPWHCAFTEDAILDDCDAFWSKIAEIMAWFLIATHNRVKGYGTRRESRPWVTFYVAADVAADDAADDDGRPRYNNLIQGFEWQNRVYTPSRSRVYKWWETIEKQWMVDNHEDYYQGCVMHMIQQWRRTLQMAKDMKRHVKNLFAITFELQSQQYDDMLHMDAIKYMGEVIAEKLGRMYGLQIHYYRKPARHWPNGHTAGISIASPGHGPMLHRLHQCSVFSLHR